MRQTLRNIRRALPTPKASDRLKTARVDDDKAFAQAKQAAAQDKVQAQVAASEDVKTVINKRKPPPDTRSRSAAPMTRTGQSSEAAPRW